MEEDNHKSDDDNEEYDSEEEETEQSLHERREAKLAEMREQLEEAKKESAEEAMRAQLLQEQETLDVIESGPLLKRKRTIMPIIIQYCFTLILVPWNEVDKL